SMAWRNDWNTNEPGKLSIDGRIPPIEPMAISLTRTDLEVLGSSAQITKSLTTDSINDFLKENPGQTVKQIAKELGVSSAKAWRTLVEERFFRLGSGTKGDPYRWFSPENPPQEGRDY